MTNVQGIKEGWSYIEPYGWTEAGSTDRLHAFYVDAAVKGDYSGWRAFMEYDYMGYKEGDEEFEGCPGCPKADAHGWSEPETVCGVYIAFPDLDEGLEECEDCAEDIPF